MARMVTKVPAEDDEAIKKAFPLIAKIRDANLRKGVVKAWYIAWKESSFTSLEEAPFGIDDPYDSLVKHSNAAASGAYAMGRQLKDEYGVKVNLDYVLAGALLHDLDKIVTYERKGNKVQRSALGKQVVHGAYGGHIALLAGLPREVVFIITAHSPKSNVELQSPEGQLISHAELGKAHAVRAAAALGKLP